MRKKTTILKTLLVAMVLLIGGGNFAWAATIATMGSTEAGWGVNNHSYTLAANKTLTLTFNITSTAGGDYDGHYVNITQDGDKMGIQPGGGFYYYGDAWWAETHIASTAVKLDDYKNVLPGSSVRIKVRRFGTQIDYFVEINKESTRLYRRLVTTAETFNASSDINVVLGADKAVLTNITDVVSDESTLGTLLGQEDNSGGFGAGMRESYVIEPEGSLTLHFINYNNQIEPWYNWAFEMDYNGEYADIVTGGGNWGKLLTDAGLTWDPSSTYPSNFFSKMDGADVLLTVTREGAKVTATSIHTATDGSTWTIKYSFTPSTTTYPDFATSDANFRLLTEGGHMDLLPINDYTVKAYDSSSNLLKVITSGTWNSGRSVTVGYPQYILSGTTLYNIPTNPSDWFHTTFTPLTADYEKQLVYNGAAVQNVFFFTEGEDIEGITQNTPSSTRTSCGKTGYTIHYSSGTESYKTVTTLPAGSYIIYTRCVAGNTERGLKIKVGDDVKLDAAIQNGTNILNNTGEFTISESSTVYISLVGSGNDGLDWLYIQKTGEVGTIASSGISSLASAYGLDFANATGLTKAYVVSKITSDRAYLTAVDELPANSGVILEGVAGDTYSIPVKADASYVGTNMLQAAVAPYNCAANKVYILQGGQFHLVTAASTVPAGKAYLRAEDVPANARSLRFVFDDEETTGIKSLTSASKGEGNIYTLSGQRVNKAQKGLYIIDGKKVVMK